MSTEQPASGDIEWVVEIGTCRPSSMTSTAEAWCDAMGASRAWLWLVMMIMMAFVKTFPAIRIRMEGNRKVVFMKNVGKKELTEGCHCGKRC